MARHVPDPGPGAQRGADAGSGAQGGPGAGAGSGDPAGGRELTLREAQRQVHGWISGFEEGYWPPLANLARLVEEVGELARELNHRHGSKPKKAGEPDADLALELADVLFVLIALANEQGIDLEDAFSRVMAKVRTRDAGRWTPKP